MSFESIPTDVILKIFDQLPFKDRVRLRGVNRLFNEISDKSINTMRWLEINDDLMNYVVTTQLFPSLLESCSPSLQSIKATNRLFKWTLNPLTEFVYPKLEHLEITVTDKDVTRKLISRNRYLRSLVLYFNYTFEWPEDVVLEKLESLAIHSYDDRGDHYVDLTPTLRPLIGKVPNLKHFTIKTIGNDPAMFQLPVEEFSQLLATAPLIQELQISRGCYVSSIDNFIADLPTWRLPNLTSLVIDLHQIPSSIFHCFPTSFPNLNSFKSERMEEIDNRDVVALSQLKQFRELRLSYSEMVNEKFIEMVTVLQSIAVLEVCWLISPRRGEIDDQVIQALSQMPYLRELYLPHQNPTKDQIIDLVTNLSSLSILKVGKISDIESPQTLIDFLTSTAARFHRDLEIRLWIMSLTFPDDIDLEQWNAIKEEVKNIDGTVVEMDFSSVRSIRYRSSDG